MRRSRIGCGKTGSEGRMSGKKNSELGVAIGGLGAIGLGVARRLDEGIPGLRLAAVSARDRDARSEEHTSELQSLMRISYAVFCLKKKNITHHKIAQTLSR